MSHDGHTIDVGHVHVVTPLGQCVEHCPHQEHRTTPKLEFRACGECGGTGLRPDTDGYAVHGSWISGDTTHRCTNCGGTGEA